MQTWQRGIITITRNENNGADVETMQTKTTEADLRSRAPTFKNVYAFAKYRLGQERA
jgi:hypothetical protein